MPRLPRVSLLMTFSPRALFALFSPFCSCSSPQADTTKNSIIINTHLLAAAAPLVRLYYRHNLRYQIRARRAYSSAIRNHELIVVVATTILLQQQHQHHHSSTRRISNSSRAEQRPQRLDHLLWCRHGTFFGLSLRTPAGRDGESHQRGGEIAHRAGGSLVAALWHAGHGKERLRHGASRAGH